MAQMQQVIFRFAEGDQLKELADLVKRSRSPKTHLEPIAFSDSSDSKLTPAKARKQKTSEIAAWIASPLTIPNYFRMVL